MAQRPILLLVAILLTAPAAAAAGQATLDAALADRAQARKRGVDPGGDIMLHGRTPPGYTGDWTDGCIAVSNAEIELLWDSVLDGATIDILP